MGDLINAHVPEKFFGGKLLAMSQAPATTTTATTTATTATAAPATPQTPTIPQTPIATPTSSLGTVFDLT